MSTYPPASLVLKVLEDGHIVEEVYAARTYYRGGREYGKMRDRCEDWGSEAADARGRELGIRCVRAFVPFPESEPGPQANLWPEVLALVRELRLLIPGTYPQV